MKFWRPTQTRVSVLIISLIIFVFIIFCPRWRLRFDANLIFSRLDRGGNRAFLTQAAAWLSDRERAVSLPARTGGEYQLTATAADFWALALRFALIPLGVLSVGLAVSVWRRRS